MNRIYFLITIFTITSILSIHTTDSVTKPASVPATPSQAKRDTTPKAQQKQGRKVQDAPIPPAPPQPLSVPTVVQKTSSVEDMKIVVNESELYEVDGITAVVFADETCRVITRSDITRPAIDGSVRSCEDMVIEQLMYDDGKKYKIVPDEEGIDKHLKTVQRENNLSQQDMELIFKRAGYSYQEGREEFARMTTVNSVVDFKLGAKRMVVPEAKIKEYYDANPGYQEAAYELQRAFVPFKLHLSHDELRDDIKNGYESLHWDSGFWIEHEQVAEDKHFIYTMNVGDVSEPIQIEEGFELFRLKDKRERRLLTLDERRMDIADILRRPQFEAALNDYKKELLDNGAVLYFD